VARIRTAEAVRTFQAKYRAFGCESQGDSRYDVPSNPADHARDGSGDHEPGLEPRKSHLPAMTTLPSFAGRESDGAL
jgi:hypothetical protein